METAKILGEGRYGAIEIFQAEAVVSRALDRLLAAMNVSISQVSDRTDRENLPIKKRSKIWERIICEIKHSFVFYVVFVCYINLPSLHFKMMLDCMVI